MTGGIRLELTPETCGHAEIERRKAALPCPRWRSALPHLFVGYRLFNGGFSFMRAWDRGQ
jgi:hypothetical protein